MTDDGGRFSHTGAAPQKEMDLYERHSLEARVAALSDHVKGYERSEAARQQQILALASQACNPHEATVSVSVSVSVTQACNHS